MNDYEQKEIFSRNLKKFLDDKELTQKEVADAIGVSAQTFNTWVQKIALPRMGKIQALADYFGIDKSDLLDDKSGIAISQSVRINIYGRVPAGIPLEAIEDIVDWEEIPLSWTTGGKEYFGLKVKGDSMQPKYLEGDNIILLKTEDCESGQDCVVFVNGYDATLKKVIKHPDHLILQPLNPAYDPVMYEYNDEDYPVTIAGVVVEIRRKV